MIMITINSIAMNVINHKCNNDISYYDNILIVVIIFYILNIIVFSNLMLALYYVLYQMKILF